MFVKWSLPHHHWLHLLATYFPELIHVALYASLFIIITAILQAHSLLLQMKKGQF